MKKIVVTCVKALGVTGLWEITHLREDARIGCLEGFDFVCVTFMSYSYDADMHLVISEGIDV